MELTHVQLPAPNMASQALPGVTLSANLEINPENSMVWHLNKPQDKTNYKGRWDEYFGATLKVFHFPVALECHGIEIVTPEKTGKPQIYLASLISWGCSLSFFFLDTPTLPLDSRLKLKFSNSLCDKDLFFSRRLLLLKTEKKTY